MIAIIDNTLYLTGSATEFGKNIVKISRCGDNILSGIILVADSSDNVIFELCTLEEREYIQSVLPACWVDKLSYWFALCKVNLSAS